MKSSTTIITAYFDIGRGDWTANKGFREKLARSVDVYFSYFERLAALENEMIIFTSPDLKPRVEAIRNWICPYISRHLLSLNPLQARCRRYSRGER
ncbi:hypothetical protein ODW73_09190, partial [Escherichia coli]|nr:hypothetical protein [Escherichia coli]